MPLIRLFLIAVMALAIGCQPTPPPPAPPVPDPSGRAQTIVGLVFRLTAEKGQHYVDISPVAPSWRLVITAPRIRTVGDGVQWDADGDPIDPSIQTKLQSLGYSDVIALNRGAILRVQYVPRDGDLEISVRGDFLTEVRDRMRKDNIPIWSGSVVFPRPRKNDRARS